MNSNDYQKPKEESTQNICKAISFFISVIGLLIFILVLLVNLFDEQGTMKWVRISFFVSIYLTINVIALWPKQ